MQVFLRTLGAGPDLQIEKPVVLLGRHEECDVQLNSTKVSRRHCIIANVDERLIIRDLGSTNGVRINGTPYEESELKHGDELSIGNFRYRVCIGDESLKPGNPNISSEFPVPLDEDESDAPVAKKDS